MEGQRQQRSDAQEVIVGAWRGGVGCSLDMGGRLAVARPSPRGCYPSPSLPPLPLQRAVHVDLASVRRCAAQLDAWARRHSVSYAPAAAPAVSPSSGAPKLPSPAPLVVDYALGDIASDAAVLRATAVLAGQPYTASPLAPLSSRGPTGTALAAAHPRTFVAGVIAEAAMAGAHADSLEELDSRAREALWRLSQRGGRRGTVPTPALSRADTAAAATVPTTATVLSTATSTGSLRARSPFARTDTQGSSGKGGGDAAAAAAAPAAAAVAAAAVGQKGAGTVVSTASSNPPTAGPSVAEAAASTAAPAASAGTDAVAAAAVAVRPRVGGASRPFTAAHLDTQRGVVVPLAAAASAAGAGGEAATAAAGPAVGTGGALTPPGPVARHAAAGIPPRAPTSSAGMPGAATAGGGSSSGATPSPRSDLRAPLLSSPDTSAPPRGGSFLFPSSSSASASASAAAAAAAGMFVLSPSPTAMRALQGSSGGPQGGSSVGGGGGGGAASATDYLRSPNSMRAAPSDQLLMMLPTPTAAGGGGLMSPHAAAAAPAGAAAAGARRPHSFFPGPGVQSRPLRPSPLGTAPASPGVAADPLRPSPLAAAASYSSSSVLRGGGAASTSGGAQGSSASAVGRSAATSPVAGSR